MKLTAKTAQAICDTYGQNSIKDALDEVINRHGGLCAVLNDDARRDFILTLGDKRRWNNAFDARRCAKFAAMRQAAAE